LLPITAIAVSFSDSALTDVFIADAKLLIPAPPRFLTQLRLQNDGRPRFGAAGLACRNLLEHAVSSICIGQCAVKSELFVPIGSRSHSRVRLDHGRLHRRYPLYGGDLRFTGERAHREPCRFQRSFTPLL
jgi:hypothetical protein